MPKLYDVKGVLVEMGLVNISSFHVLRAVREESLLRVTSRYI